MKFPDLELNQYGVVQAESATGIILNPDGSYYKNVHGEEVMLIFESLEEAKNFCNRKISEYPKIECHIFNHLKERVTIISNRSRPAFSAQTKIIKR